MRILLIFYICCCLVAAVCANALDIPLDQKAVQAAPVLNDLQIVFVRRSVAVGETYDFMRRLGFPTNHESHAALQKTGYDNEIVLLDLASGDVKSLYKPPHNGYVGDLDLHWDGKWLLFTQSDEQNWKLWEIGIDGAGLRQISHTPDDVDCFDACYLPDGRIITASNAPWQCIPCWHGEADKYVANLYVMNADGSGMRRLCFDQDHDIHPSVCSDGQVIYSRWDYTGINRLFLRPLMTMNPDGTGQQAIYGSNSWFPNGLYSPHEVPGHPGKFLCILAGYHGSNRDGHLVILDTNKGTQEEKGIVQRISGAGLPLEVKYMDRLTDSVVPRFLTPRPVTDKLFLVSAQTGNDARSIGLYLATAADELYLIRKEKGHALLEPTPILKRPLPAAIPDRTDLESAVASVFIQDVYVGKGLAGVPRGIIKSLRVIAYNFGYIGLAGTDKIGLSGPWEAMRILGAAPVNNDGSASFYIPANTPVAFQALDGEGKAIQLMRSWFTAMPGEAVSCVGCHESTHQAPPTYNGKSVYGAPAPLTPWYGPARGFDFAREVQPVLNRYCISCHNDEGDMPDLRPEARVTDYTGRAPGYYDRTRMHPVHKKKYGGNVKYTPAYEALLPYIRRVSIGDAVNILNPGHYHADTSELVQMLQNGHYGVTLDEASWRRIVTWIDLNGPCHGTWQEVFACPIPDKAHERRRELAALYGGPAQDPETVSGPEYYDETPVLPPTPPSPRQKKLIRKDVPAQGDQTMSLSLNPDHAIELVRITDSCWMSVCEITNEQFRRIIPEHNSSYYSRRHAERADSKGMSLNAPEQPALRVSFNEAMAFCACLSRQTGKEITLPTEEQWETACCGYGETDFFYGDVDDDFSSWANMADKTFASFGVKDDDGQHFRIAGDVDYIDAEGVALADRRYEDGGCVTMPVGSYQPNTFGLYDMHGNAAEWTLTEEDGEHIVKGGSYLDRPKRCSAATRSSFPPWQKVYDVGFRIVVNEIKNGS